MSNIFHGSTLRYFQVSNRDFELLRDCKEATVKLFLAACNRMQKYSSVCIAWTTEQQMTEAKLRSRRSVMAARQELKQKGIVTISEVEGRKGLWAFVLTVPSKELDLDTVTACEAREYYMQFLVDEDSLIETDSGLQCDCPLHIKPTTADKSGNKVYSRGKRTFNIDLTSSIGTWWCHCYGDYHFGRTLDFEKRKRKVTTTQAHKNVTCFFQALREKQREERFKPREPYQPTRQEKRLDNALSEAF